MLAECVIALSPGSLTFNVTRFSACGSEKLREPGDEAVCLFACVHAYMRLVLRDKKQISHACMYIHTYTFVVNIILDLIRCSVITTCSMRFMTQYDASELAIISLRGREIDASMTVYIICMIT